MPVADDKIGKQGHVRCMRGPSLTRSGVNPVPAQPLQNFHFKPLQGPGAVKHKFVFKVSIPCLMKLH